MRWTCADVAHNNDDEEEEEVVVVAGSQKLDPGLITRFKTQHETNDNFKLNLTLTATEVESE